MRRLKSVLDRAAAAYADDLSRRWQQGVPRPLVPIASSAHRSAVSAERRLAVICHVFYPDLLDEVREAAERLPGRTDLYLSVVSEQDRDVLVDRLSDWSSGDVDVRIVENRGRDIAPKYVAFADVYGRGYELLLLLHTKKSTNEVVGPRWRRFLFDSLAGSRERVDQVLGLFDEDPGLGVLAPEHYGPIVPWIGWDGNFPRTRDLAARMGLTVHPWSPPDFPSGSMFWARPEALAPITRLRLGLSDFPAEDAQIQSTIMHALERLVYLGAASAQFRSAVLEPASILNPPDAGSPPPAPGPPPAGSPPLTMRATSVVAVLRGLARDSMPVTASTRAARAITSTLRGAGDRPSA